LVTSAGWLPMRYPSETKRPAPPCAHASARARQGAISDVQQIREGAAAILFDFKRDIASLVSWKGGRFAHQRPHSIMDNADNTAVGYLNNAPVSHLAFILPPVGCSVFVAGSDIGPKVLDMIGLVPVHPIHFASVAERGERNGRTKRLEKLVV